MLEEARATSIDAPDASVVELEALACETRERADVLNQPWPRRVINATGIVLHTNLGRAPLAADAAAEVARASTGYSDLELDLETGERGSRVDRVAELLCLLSGAEAAHVVNNTAAALLLSVEALAGGREVVLSRGELVEIGGSFRVPEIMASSSARLCEIGTTNRTHLSDYRDAIGPQTGMLLKVHRSNFSIDGFTTEVTLDQLGPLGREHDLPVVEDRGSGSFINLRPHGVPEPEVWEGLRAGADRVLFSGDKLLGGPQAGIVLGSRELIAPLKRHPLARAVRVDKMTLAALHWTLRALLEGREHEIPVVGMLLAPLSELEARAQRLASGLRAAGWAEVEVEKQASSVGGGALPEVEIPSVVVRIACRAAEPQESGGRGKSSSPSDLAQKLRMGRPPILVRVHRDAVQLDPRTLLDSELDALVEALGSRSR